MVVVSSDCMGAWSLNTRQHPPGAQTGSCCGHSRLLAFKGLRFHTRLCNTRHWSTCLHVPLLASHALMIGMIDSRRCWFTCFRNRKRIVECSQSGGYCTSQTDPSYHRSIWIIFALKSAASSPFCFFFLMLLLRSFFKWHSADWGEVAVFSGEPRRRSPSN